jgi:acyl carrier protein
MKEEEYIVEINKLIDTLEERHTISFISNIDETFRDDLFFDSLSLVELAMDCEHRFSVKMTDEEIASIKTVKDLIRIIEENKK